MSSGRHCEFEAHITITTRISLALATADASADRARSGGRPGPPRGAASSDTLALDPDRAITTTGVRTTPDARTGAARATPDAQEHRAIVARPDRIASSPSSAVAVRWRHSPTPGPPRPFLASCRCPVAGLANYSPAALSMPRPDTPPLTKVFSRPWFRSCPITIGLPPFPSLLVTRHLAPATIAGMFTYVGCYTTPDRGGSGNGINAYRMDTGTGAWTHLGVAADVPNPSFLTLDPTSRFLYCVHGGNDFSAVSAFALDASSGELTPLGTQECGGPNPVALSVCKTAPFLVVANYNTAPSRRCRSTQMARRPDRRPGPNHRRARPPPDRAEHLAPAPHPVRSERPLLHRAGQGF